MTTFATPAEEHAWAINEASRILDEECAPHHAAIEAARQKFTAACRRADAVYERACVEAGNEAFDAMLARIEYDYTED